MTARTVDTATSGASIDDGEAGKQRRELPAIVVAVFDETHRQLAGEGADDGSRLMTDHNHDIVHAGGEERTDDAAQKGVAVQRKQGLGATHP